MLAGLRLKEKQISKGYSQTEIAALLKVNRYSYNSWESGISKTKSKNLTALATILDVPVSYFESEYNFVNNCLQLSPDNQVRAEEYVEHFLSQQTSHITPLFSVQVLSDVQLSAGLCEGLFDEFETEIVYSDEGQYGYDIEAWIEGNSMEATYQKWRLA